MFKNHHKHDRCIYMWTEIWDSTSTLVNHNLDYGSDYPFSSVPLLYRNLICVVYDWIAIMVDKVSSINLSPEVDTKKGSATKRQCAKNCDLNGKIKSGTKYYNFSANNNHVDKHVDDMSNITKISKSELLPQEIEKSCQEKVDAGATTTWKRRDSFSSCSSDSVGYCSSGNAQIDVISQDAKNAFNKGTIQKKRQRHSSDSSALSSSSETSDKGANLPTVKGILSCLEDDLTKSLRTESIVSKHSSITHFPSTINQSKVATFVEKKTLSYTCKTFEKSPSNDEKQHNLRRQIRRKTCHNCDCSGSHTTVVYRKFTQIKRATTTTTTTTTKHTLPTLSLSSPTDQKSINLPALPVQTEKIESKDCPFSTPKGANKKRRREVDKLYDALHEIKWAKHMSPDNILSQIDFRRAATDSFYSSKSKAQSSESEDEKLFKCPQTVKGNHLTKDICKEHKVSHCNVKQNKSLKVHSANQNSSSCNRHNFDQNVTSGNKHVEKSRPVTPKHHAMSLRSFPKDNQPRNGYPCENHKLRKVKQNESKCKESIKKTISNNTTDLNFSDMTSFVLPETEENLLDREPSNLSCDKSFVDSPHHNSDLQLPAGECNAGLQEVDETDTSESLIVEEIWTDGALENAEQLKDRVHFGCGHECLFLTPVESSCVEDEVVFAYLDPFVQDVETTVEVTCQNDSKLTSPTLPHLTKVSPMIEHTSEESPPSLELCIDQSPPCVSLINESINISGSHLPDSSLMCKVSDSSSCVTLSEVNYVENIVSSNPVLDVAKFNPENKTNTDSKPVSVRKKLKCKVFSRGDYNKRKKLVPKYFSKSKTRLKTVLQYSSPSRAALRYSSPSKTVSQVIEKNHSHENVIPKSTSTDIDNHITGTVQRLNKEDCNALIKNDSLRVRVRGLDHVVVRDHLERYNHMVSQATAHQSVVCTRVETSGTINERRTRLSAKQEINYKHYYSNNKSISSGEKTKTLALEYKGPQTRSDVQIPYKFTYHYRCITVNKGECYMQIIFKLTNGKNTYLSIEALKELRNALNAAVQDDECQVLIMNSIGQSFCSGLDLSPLVGPRKDTASKEMADAVKEFIEALAAFRKPLVVVVNGEAMGLGVTLLAYSDVILASEISTFHMPYSQLGYSPEGAATLMLPFVVGSTVAMDMMLRGRMLSAYEAQDFGLITEVLSANHLPYKLVERVQQLAENPSSAMESTKSMLRTHLYHRLGLALESETAMLPDQWLSDPCQAAIRDAFNSGLLNRT